MTTGVGTTRWTRKGRRLTPALGVAAAASLTFVLTGCGADALIWGPEGAGVIETTERLIEAASAGDGDSFVCGGYEPNLGTAADWHGLSAEEPERFVADFWREQVPLEPDWSINLSPPMERVVSGEQVPGNVFYRLIDDRLCVVDVVWATMYTGG